MEFLGAKFLTAICANLTDLKKIDFCRFYRFYSIEKGFIASSLNAEVVVLGSGSGGYTAAFRAADLGKKVILIEKYDSIGGVCLNVGCIPSKALLHATKVMDEAEDMSNHGIVFSKPKVDLKKLVEWKQSVINRLTGGLAALAKQRNVQIVKGYGKFLSDKSIEVVEGSQKTTITLKIV